MPGVNKVHHPQLWETVAKGLRDAILSGELKPGDKLVETELAEQFGVSRGPIREALRDLARAGLVVELPRRGTVVSAVTLRDLNEIYDVREALDTAAATMAMPHVRTADLSRFRQHIGAMEEGWRADDPTVAWAADWEFHREIVRMTGNGRMLSLYEQLVTQTAMLLRAATETNPSLRLSPPRTLHRAILSAIADGNPEAARQAVVAHYRHTRERLFMFIDDTAPQEAPLRPRLAGRVQRRSRVSGSSGSASTESRAASS